MIRMIFSICEIVEEEKEVCAGCAIIPQNVEFIATEHDKCTFLVSCYNYSMLVLDII